MGSAKGNEVTRAERGIQKGRKGGEQGGHQHGEEKNKKKDEEEKEMEIFFECPTPVIPQIIHTAEEGYQDLGGKRGGTVGKRGGNGNGGGGPKKLKRIVGGKGAGISKGEVLL